MKILILTSILFSSLSFAETYIVEMQKPLTNSQIQNAQKVGIKAQLFDSSPSDYFRRTYRVETSTPDEISKHLPVKVVEDVYRAMHLSLEPKKSSVFLTNDELFHFQWGLLNQSQSIEKLVGGKKVVIEGRPNVDIRWKESIKKIEAGLKKEPLIAVIDMGIDLDHPDLKGRIFKNFAECDENGEIIDSDEDKDKNGLKGDCQGWNFAAQTMYEARRPIDDDGHGTHVSGIIAAETNKVGISGVSSKIKILPIKVTGKIDETSDKKNIQPLTDRIAKGILYAANMGADVINLSLGWTRSMDTKYLNEAIDYALGKGVIIVSAAGNNNNNASIFPCARYDVICVGAVTIDGTVAEFSNYGGEVDILAPGDEIVSTIPREIIPLQRNIQGYDIRSGTSQATPFVSAAAALLRGTFPRLHREEVFRRIVDSADQGILGKSMSGLLNLQGAFDIQAAPSIKPIFKNFSVALFDGTSKKFNFPFNIKNFGFDASNVVIKIKSLSAAFKLDQVFQFPLLRPGEVVTSKLDGEVIDSNAHNQVQIEVSVLSDNQPEKIYRHEFRLARDILRDDKVRTIAFDYANSPLPVGMLKDGSVRNLVNTVETYHLHVGVPEFYLPRNVKETTSIELKFFRNMEGSLKEIPGMITLPNAIQLLNVMRLDVNHDGIDDYLVRTIACEKDCGDPTKADRHIQYSFWKNDLSPLFGEKSIWRFLPTIANVDLKSQRFFKLKHDVFGVISVPMFIENGTIPYEQQELRNSFSLPDLSSSRRIYYLYPEVNDKKQVEFKTKTVSTASFLNKLRTFANAFQSDDVQVMHLLNQDEVDFESGKVKAIYSVGKGYLRKNVVVDLLDGKEIFDLFSISQNIFGYEYLTSQNLVDGKDLDSFLGMTSNSTLVMLQTELNRAYAYKAGESVEIPIAAIASFAGHNEEFTFFQTPSYLMLAHHTLEGLDFSRLKINRFSFLPGTLFNDTFYPILAKSNDAFVAALYVDETDIQSNLVSVTVFEDQKLKSPLSKSVFIPPICKPMDPVRLLKESGHFLSLLCLENKQWVMKFIDQDR